MLRVHKLHIHHRSNKALRYRLWRQSSVDTGLNRFESEVVDNFVTGASKEIRRELRTGKSQWPDYRIVSMNTEWRLAACSVASLSSSKSLAARLNESVLNSALHSFPPQQVLPVSLFCILSAAVSLKLGN